jgi:L-aspartate oxidase
VWRHIAAGHRVYLDARAALGARFAQRFPSIAAHFRAAGIDPATVPIPVRPAAHYHMGGIAVDHAGRSSVPGLWVCGEAAATGLHGANRLASNSLLEATVCGGWVAESIAATPAGLPRPLALVDLPPEADPMPVRSIMEEKIGVMRDQSSLTDAVTALTPLAFGNTSAANPALIGVTVAVAALLRTESRGGHWRSDFPQASTALATRKVLRLGEVETIARRVLAERAPRQVAG